MTAGDPDLIALRALSLIDSDTVQAARQALAGRLRETPASEASSGPPLLNEQLVRMKGLLAQRWHRLLQTNDVAKPGGAQVLREAVDELAQQFVEELAHCVVRRLDQARKRPPAVAPAPDAAAPSVLVVEDQPDTRELFRRILTPRFDVTLAGTADEALGAARAQCFDALVLDINLREDRTGCDVLTALRAFPGYAAVPALACTAYLSEDNFMSLVATGFTAVLAKPFKKEALLEAVDQLLASDRDPVL